MAKQMRICVLAGDGIGPEITRQALKIVGIAADYLEMELVRDEGLIGGAAIDAEGLPLPLQTITHCRSADAVLLGAVGGSKWDTLPMHLRPEAGLMALRARWGLYANIRPAMLLKPLRSVAPLHSDIAGFDLLMVRELAGGIYFGDKGRQMWTAPGLPMTPRSIPLRKLSESPALPSVLLKTGERIWCPSTNPVCCKPPGYGGRRWNSFTANSLTSPCAIFMRTMPPWN